jgi:ABC-2 type transport system permease protein
MKNKTFLIFRHEFLHTVRKKGFIIITISVPLLALIAIGIGRLVSNITDEPVIDVKTIGYVDETGSFTTNTSTGHTIFIKYGSLSDATQALIEHKVPEYFVIPPDYYSTGAVRLFTLEKKIEASQFTRFVIKSFLTANLLEGEVGPDTVSLVNSPLNLEVTRLTETGQVDTEQGSLANFLLCAVFALLLALSLMLNSTYLIQGLGDEKENRLIEVLLSSVSVRQLLTGKVLGLGAVGFAQVLVWLISAPLLLTLAPSSVFAFVDSMNIPAVFYILGAVYFILGFLFFAVLSIGVGAISPNAQEGHTLALFYTLLNFAPLWFVSLVVFFPGSPVWTILSIFPVTAPVQTMLRLGVTDIPLWEILASITVLILSIIFGLSLVIRIFRVHLLMHGKRPGIRQVFRNLKNA